jgi:hypothetical protein
MWTNVTDSDAKDQPSSAKTAMSGTALSIFHDTKRRWLVYQNSDGLLVAQNEKDQFRTSPAKLNQSYTIKANMTCLTASLINTDAGNFIESTPIGSCFIPGYKEGTLGRAIVYWIRRTNKADVLYRSHADIIAKTKTSVWSDPKPATDSGT